ncbi:superfamily II DNA or RNA helicase [Ereboglobus sp. PH5-5]|uniref:helicase-related protein n=1 Tax=Ereboglobus sp. PH5-5 TaxID=2940529 RepID=UPI0024062B8E|nr:helicase-related protein [Ereboglobus sp. PH5-5]MDF9834019.1 superfamily II DNA or RNA helicase [Ereboglobus sp. PH5-5]
MSTKFFTNEEGRALIEKIEGIFEHKRIHFLDVLVGYFRASGYFRIRPFVQKSERIRILVGINIDRLVQEAWDKGLQFGVNPASSRAEFLTHLARDIQESAYDRPVEEGMLGLVGDIVDGRVEIRIHPAQNIHAKLYIFREETKHSHGYGAVITGSSNLTDAGLERNFEFNVELRDDHDIEFATTTFEKLWDEGIAIKPEHVQQIKQQTFLNDSFTPYELFIKFLTEYFGAAIHYDPTVLEDLPSGFKKLSYQADAVNDGYAKLQKHGGFFLSDVVGLGKTLVATLIAKRFYYTNGFVTNHHSATLFVVPPALVEYWEETIRQIDLKNTRIITTGSLHKIRHPEDYDLIIVDEAHKFRTDTSEMYRELQRICKSPTRRRDELGRLYDKKVILISATPLNNRPSDIASLVYLFQDSKDSTLDETANLQHFFAPLIKTYDRLKRESDPVVVREGVRAIYDRIRTHVIQPLTVRRTRRDLWAHDSYRNDIVAQGIKFPDVQAPEKIYYKLPPVLDDLYDRTIWLLSDPAGGLTYNRYRAIAHLKPEKCARYQQAKRISDQLATIMKTLLVKRLDSSFHAFRKSLGRFATATRQMVGMFEKGKIYIAPNLPVSEYLADDREEDLLKLIAETSDTDPTIQVCEPDDFDASFVEGLRRDASILENLVSAWNDITTDPKLDEFISRLKCGLFDKKLNPSRKLIVFSESAETTDYLVHALANAGFERTLAVTSANRKDMLPLAKANFDASVAAKEQDSCYDILISTEVLAEGVNLHRANIVVNYDTPWNSTRLMQRVGRVNRIGSPHAAIHIFNFFPTSQVEGDIQLEKKAKMKLHAFHAALGEDSQIYSDEESPETFGLFEKTVKEEVDERLSLLMELRAFKGEHPDRFKQIKNLPRRARTGRTDGTHSGSTLAFIRSHRRDAFIQVSADGEHQELTFLEAASRFRAEPAEKARPFHQHHHEQVQTAIALFNNMLQEDLASEQKVDPKLGPNEKKALQLLSALRQMPVSSEKECALLESAQHAIRVGKFQQLHRDLNKLQKAVKGTPVAPSILLERVVAILGKYPIAPDEEAPPERPGEHTPRTAVRMPEIIISESFV